MLERLGQQPARPRLAVEDSIEPRLRLQRLPPAIPSNVQASDGGYTDKVRLTWSSAAGATAYEVWRSTGNNSGSATLLNGSVSGLSYNDATAVAGVTYYYWVKAKNSGGTSGFRVADSGYRSEALSLPIWKMGVRPKITPIWAPIGWLVPPQ